MSIASRAMEKDVPLFLLGPTASGKSALALKLAQDSGLGIAAVDAFQVYQGMDIGTAKPPAAERERVPHILLDLASPVGEFSVADYLSAADQYAQDARRWIWTGGTGLYYRALLCGLSPAPRSDPATVERLTVLPLQELQRRIRELDPEWADTADLKNPRRVVRALAVALDTGRPLSAWHKERHPALIPEAVAILLNPAPELLRRRITARVEAMWKQGWPDEVRSLMADPAWSSSRSAKAIGYLEIAAFIDHGGDAAEIRAAIATATWQYARRQLTWFRREGNLHVIDFDDERAVEPIVRGITASLPSFRSRA